jgi:DNA-directed RNA polymerase specialized sigma24 family protein
VTIIIVISERPVNPPTIAGLAVAHCLLALDEALTKLAAEQPQVAALVNLRYFAGLTGKQAAAALGIAPRTAAYHRAYARAWLRAEFQDSS